MIRAALALAVASLALSACQSAAIAGEATVAAPQAKRQANEKGLKTAVFVGGSGGELAALIELILTRLKPSGRLVMN